MAITAFLSRSPGLLNRGLGSLVSLGHVPHSSIFSPTGLKSNWLNFLCTELYNCLTSTFFLWASQTAFNSTRPRSRLYPDIPRPDAPVIYTGAFPILTAWPGRRSISNRRPGFQSQVESYQKLKKWYLIFPCLTLNIIRIKSKVEQSREISSALPYTLVW